MRILVFGSANIDFSLSVDKIAVSGETISCNGMKKSAGGKGANQAYAIAKAGSKPFFAGKVGSDGRFILDKLEDAGADVSLVLNSEKGTGCAFIQVDDSGQNCIVVYGGGNQEITRDEVDSVLGHFGSSDAVVLNGEIGQLGYIYNSAFSKGMRIFLNPSPVNEAVKALDLKKASVLFFNEIEGAYFAGEEMPYADMLWTLMRRYPDSEIVLTVGSEGAYYGFGDIIFKVPPVKVEAIDTTGAGDTFMGFFISERCSGKGPEESMRTATRASSLAVSRQGAMDSIPSILELI